MAISASAYISPVEWKSEVWWRKRSADERLFHLRLPARIQTEVTTHKVATKWPGGSALIQGRPGTGKSLMAAAMLIDAVQSDETSGRWVEADDYIEMIKDSFDNDGLLPEMYSSPHLVKYVKGVFDVVVIDGLGEERQTEFATHELGSLIRKRYDRMKHTIVTSSMSLGDIKNRYGSRLATALADFILVPSNARK